MKCEFIKRLCTQPGASKKDADELNPYGVTWLGNSSNIEISDKKEDNEKYIELINNINNINIEKR